MNKLANKLAFNVEKTSQGYLVFSEDVPIVLEVEKEDEILQYTKSAIDCYIETLTQINNDTPPTDVNDITTKTTKQIIFA